MGRRAMTVPPYRKPPTAAELIQQLVRAGYTTRLKLIEQLGGAGYRPAAAVAHIGRQLAAGAIHIDQQLAVDTIRLGPPPPPPPPPPPAPIHLGPALDLMAYFTAMLDGPPAESAGSDEAAPP